MYSYLSFFFISRTFQKILIILIFFLKHPTIDNRLDMLYASAAHQVKKKTNLKKVIG
jgi:hypothetical protein